MNPAEQQRLADEIVRLAGQLAAATCRWLGLVADFDRAEAWKAWGCRSCAHWLSWHCGVGLHAAGEKLRVARALQDLPLVRARFEAGELSYSKVRALTRIATADTEADVVELARHATGAHLERIAGAYRSAELRSSLDAQRVQELRREVTWCRDDHGGVVGRFRLPAEEGERLIARLLDHPGTAAGATLAQRAAYALLDLIDGTTTPPTVVVHVDAADLLPTGTSGAADPHGGVSVESGETAGDTGPADEDVSAETYHAADDEGTDASDLAAPHRPPTETAPPASRPPAGREVPYPVAQRLTCDAIIEVLVLDGDGQPLNLGRKRRTVSPAQRRALEARDRGCRFPGCPADRWLKAHHIHYWGREGPTDLDNLVLLCRHHHKVVHDFGWAIHLEQPRGGGRAELVVTDPDGNRLDPHPPYRHRGDLRDIDNPGIHPAAIRSLWAGEHLDLATAVEVLLWRNHRVGPPLWETAA
jgi:hypothetical protein